MKSTPVLLKDEDKQFDTQFKTLQHPDVWCMFLWPFETEKESTYNLNKNVSRLLLMIVQLIL